jgi:hypothetical protein
MSNAQVFNQLPIYGTTPAANNATPVAVAVPAITASSVVLLSLASGAPAGANAGQARVVSQTAGTGFSFASGAADTSVYKYVVF